MLTDKPRLLDQVRERLRLKHYSLRTEQAYVEWIRRFIRFHGRPHPAELRAREVEQFLHDLAVGRNVAASTQHQAPAAVLFLYREGLAQDFGWLEDLTRAKKPQRWPVMRSAALAEAFARITPSDARHRFAHGGYAAMPYSHAQTALSAAMSVRHARFHGARYCLGMRAHRGSVRVPDDVES